MDRRKDDPRGDSIIIHVPDANRVKLLEALATMPDEAFQWFVLATLPSAQLRGANRQIWPDGIGGFMADSKSSITAIRAAAEAYVQYLKDDARDTDAKPKT